MKWNFLGLGRWMGLNPRKGRSRGGKALALGLALLLVCPIPARADRYAEYLEQLRDEGLADMALEYLETLKTKGILPPELQRSFEMEAANCLLRLADEAPTPEKAQERILDAQARLSKFIQANPQGDEATAAESLLGDLGTERGRILLRSAMALTDKTKQTESLKNARASLEQARPHFRKAAEQYYNAFEKLQPEEDDDGETKRTSRRRQRAKPGESKVARERARLEQLFLEIRFKLALLDYYVAQTYTDRADPNRKTALTNSGKAFDAIYQPNRGMEVGLYAHMWHGRTADELGNLQLALDIYEEVLANAPERGSREVTGFEALFANVQLFYLQALLKKGKTDDVLDEAQDWLKANKASIRTPGYQGIALELAKAQIAQAEKGDAKERRKAFTDALKLLKDITKVRSEYQSEAFLLLRKHQAETRGAPSEIASFEEGVAVADSTMASGNFKEAEAFYAKALEFKEKAKDSEQANTAQYHLAYVKYNLGKMEEACKTAEDLARSQRNSKSAPKAAALAVSAALSLYASSNTEGREAALNRLRELAKFTSEYWSSRPEADDARLALGQADLVRGSWKEAIEAFEAVDPQSERFPIALHLAGQTYWRLYITGLQNEQRDANALAETRAKARKRLSDSLERQVKAAKTNEPMSRQQIDTQLLLGEIAVEGKVFPEAAKYLDPLVNQVEAAKPKGLDNTTLRILIGGMRAFLGVGNMEKAGKVQEIVAGVGEDDARINGVLIGFARILHQEVKILEGQVTKAKEGELEKLKTKKEGADKVLYDLLVQLSKRQQHSLGNLLYIGDTCFQLNQMETAREVYERILQIPTESLPPQGDRAVMRVRAQLVGLLRREGKFEDALAQVAELITANPRSLEPMLEKCRILQGWAERDNDPKRYEQAVSEWTRVRNLLGRLQRKPPEYYEVIYHTAVCLMAQFNETKDAEKAKQAEQILNASLILNPKLSGPDMVARYEKLLEETRAAQNR